MTILTLIKRGISLFQTSNSLEKDFLKYYNLQKKEIESGNDTLCNRIITNNIGIASEEYLSILFSTCITEDIDLLIGLKDSAGEQRLKYAIIRNICEQVIEYKYLCANKYLIKEYFGSNIPDSFPQDMTDIQILKKVMGDGRYSKKRNMHAWAKAICEADESNQNNDMSLYTIYQISSTAYHQSYFNHVYDLVGEVEEDVELAETDETPYIMLIFLLTKFADSYDEIVSRKEMR